MNKYERSLENLKNIQVGEDELLVDYAQYETFNEDLEPIRFDVNETFDNLQELIDKATPKKPTKDYSINIKFPMIKYNYVCPNCNNTLALQYDEEPNNYDSYCGTCGQAIDWSEYE